MSGGGGRAGGNGGGLDGGGGGGLDVGGGGGGREYEGTGGLVIRSQRARRSSVYVELPSNSTGGKAIPV